MRVFGQFRCMDSEAPTPRLQGDIDDYHRDALRTSQPHTFITLPVEGPLTFLFGILTK